MSANGSMRAHPPSSASRSGHAARLPFISWCAGVLLVSAGGALANIPHEFVLIAGAACLAPALLGLSVPFFPRQEWLQVIMICSWIGLALGAAVTLGATSAAACWFLLPPFIAFLLGRRSLILETGVTSVLALGLAVALEAGDLAPPLYPAAEYPVLSIASVALAVLFATVVAASARRQVVLERVAARRRHLPLEQFAGRFPAAMLRLDQAGTIVDAVGAVEQVLGRDSAALLGTAASTLSNRADAGSAIQSAIDEVRRFGQETRFDLRLAGGGVVEFCVAADGDGVVAVGVDVTHRAKRERATIAERDAAMSANEAKSRFLASMSHEIRTPLNAIIGFSDVMKQRLFGPMPARYAEYADLIHESGRHLLDLVGDVLDMSKIEADRYELKLEQMDVRDVAAAATKLVSLRAEETGVRLELDCGLAPLQVRADRKALRQILLNLLSNALKFTPRGGTVRLALRSDGGELVVEIADTGAGMTEAELQRIGAPYQQAGSAHASVERGTGLGLSLVAALAHLHGGTLEIESVVGEGTTARVRLPVLEAAPPVVLDARARLKRVVEASEGIRQAQADAQAQA